MHIIVMRHPERTRDVPEKLAQLTDRGKAHAKETAASLGAKLPPLDLILRSDVQATKDTAEVFAALAPIPLDKVVVCPALAPDIERITLADIEPYVPRETRTIAVIGHHPGVTHLLIALVGKSCRTIERGEAIWVECDGSCGFVRATFGSTYTNEALRKKVELKMTVSTFLAGFTIPVLVELVKDGKEGFTACQLAATVLFTAAFCLFAAAVYMYDELLMPTEFWGPVDQKRKPAADDRSQFAHHYRLNGRIYAYMVRTWSRVFTPAVGCTALGFFSLILNKWPGEHVGWGLFGCAMGVVAGCLVYWRWRPQLGIED